MTIRNLTMLQDVIDNEITSHIDPEENTFLHNEICDLLKEAHAVENISELESVITQGKTIEKKLDLWFTKIGKETLDLTWEIL